MFLFFGCIRLVGGNRWLSLDLKRVGRYSWRTWLIPSLRPHAELLRGNRNAGVVTHPGACLVGSRSCDEGGIISFVASTLQWVCISHDSWFGGYGVAGQRSGSFQNWHLDITSASIKINTVFHSPAWAGNTLIAYHRLSKISVGTVTMYCRTSVLCCKTKVQPLI